MVPTASTGYVGHQWEDYGTPWEKRCRRCGLRRGISDSGEIVFWTAANVWVGTTPLRCWGAVVRDKPQQAAMDAFLGIPMGVERGDCLWFTEAEFTTILEVLRRRPGDGGALERKIENVLVLIRQDELESGEL